MLSPVTHWFESCSDAEVPKPSLSLPMDDKKNNSLGQNIIKNTAQCLAQFPAQCLAYCRGRMQETGGLNGQ